MGGGGRRGGKPGESNEEAMLRMTSKGRGKGGRTGHSGKGKGPPPSLDEIPEERRNELRSQVDSFVAGSEPQLAMPASLNGLERKLVHTLCEEFGLSSQSFGTGVDRYICILRPEPSATSAAGDGGAAAAGEGEEARLGREAGEEEKLDSTKQEALQVDPRTVTYSAVVLDDASQKRLREFCNRDFAVPNGWTEYGDHLTICMGPLSDPSTLDTRSVGDLIRQQVGSLRDRQELDLQVISTGRSNSAMAVGVMGCPSCNRNPHITVATEPDKAPVSSNEIRKWDMLPADGRISLHGMVWQRSRTRREDPPPWAWAHARPTSVAQAAADPAADAALAAALRLSKAVLSLQRESKPRRMATLRSFLKRRALHLQLYTVHPAKLAVALSDALPAAVVQALEVGLRPPTADPMGLFSKPAEVPADVLPRVRRDLARIQQRGAFGVPGCARWLADQAKCLVSVDAETAVEGLQKAGVLSVDAEGAVKYEALGDESVADARAATPYLQAWPLELLRPTWEVQVDGEWESLPAQAMRPLREALKRGEKQVGYVTTQKEGRRVRKTAYTLDLEHSQQIHDETGWRNALRKTGF